MEKEDRQCGKCSECCKAPVVEFPNGEVKKSLERCKYLCAEASEKGCMIFGQDMRPKMCATFFCLWKRGYGGEEDRPDKNGIFIAVPDAFNGGIWIVVMDQVKDAHRTTGKEIILDVADKIDLPVIVADHDNLKHGKGDYVIIKDSLQHRSSKIKGEFIGDFGHMKEYRLEIS